eukprot:c17470_g1_i1 orf=300-1292(-)
MSVPTVALLSTATLTLQSDGSILRDTTTPLSRLLPCNPHFTDGVATRDVNFCERETNPEVGKNHLWVRLFLPEIANGVVPKKLPVVVYFHGGGFVRMSAAAFAFHRPCADIARTTPALVVSVEYRLSPEHRLPAAFEDGFAVLKWLHKQVGVSKSGPVDPWLASYADVSRCFLAGCSAGGRIVHQVALMASGSDLAPLRIRGLILQVPFFGGVSRTPAEIKSAEEEALPLPRTDAYWALSLPLGEDRDHPFSNALRSQADSIFTSDWPPSLVLVAGRDVLYDRDIEYVEALQKAGKDVKWKVFEESDHAMLGKFYEPSIQEIVQFIQSKA